MEQWLIEGNMSLDEAVANAVGMLGAGMDTTAHTTAFMLYEHPEVQEKACEQLTSVMGNEDADGNSLPFGFGPRGCWGRFAEVEMKVLLSQLARHFKMECDYPDDRLPYEGITTSRPTVPIKIKFTPR